MVLVPAVIWPTSPELQAAFAEINLGVAKLSSRPRILATPLIVLCLTVPLHGQVIGEAVLLKNDRTLEGKVEQRGDFYSIQVAEQSRVSIPKSQVEHVGASKLALYEHKRSKIHNWEVGDHFQLTRWCLLNGLLDQAVVHYQEVAKEHGPHPRVKQLALELKNKLLEVPEFRTHLGLTPDTTHEESLLPEGQQVDSNATAVVNASATLVGAAMHPEIAAHFSRRIQPILLNRCSQAACHGAQSDNGLRLIEPYRAAYQRVSSQNLASVLGQISMDPGQIAPLIRYATEAHGIQTQPAIAVTETQLLQELAQWIQFVQSPVIPAVSHVNTSVGQAVPAMGFGLPAHYSPAVTLVPVQPGSSGLKPVPKFPEAGMPGVANHANPRDFPGGDVPLESEMAELERQLQQILGETQPAQTFQSDPFDPDEFNRQSRASLSVPPVGR